VVVASLRNSSYQVPVLYSAPGGALPKVLPRVVQLVVSGVILTERVLRLFRSSVVAVADHDEFGIVSTDTAGLFADYAVEVDVVPTPERFTSVWWVEHHAPPPDWFRDSSVPSRARLVASTWSSDCASASRWTRGSSSESAGAS